MARLLDADLRKVIYKDIPVVRLDASSIVEGFEHQMRGIFGGEGRKEDAQGNQIFLTGRAKKIRISRVGLRGRA